MEEPMPQVPCPGCHRSITLEFDDLTKVIECGGCDTRFGPLVRAGNAVTPLDHLEIVEPAAAPPVEEKVAPATVLAALPSRTAGLREVDLAEGQSRDFVPAELQPMPKEPSRKRPAAPPPGPEGPPRDHVPLVLSLGAGLLAVVIVMGTLALLFFSGAFNQRPSGQESSGVAAASARSEPAVRRFPERDDTQRPAPPSATAPTPGAGFPRPTLPPRMPGPPLPGPPANGPAIDGGTLPQTPQTPRFPRTAPVGPSTDPRRPVPPGDPDDDPFEGRRGQLPDLRPRPPGADAPEDGPAPAEDGRRLPARPGDPPPAEGRTVPAPSVVPERLPSGWIVWTVVGTKFSAWLPARPTSESRGVTTPAGPAVQTTFTAENGRVTSTVAVALFRGERKTLPEDKLYRFAQRAALKQLGATLDSEGEVTCGDRKGRSAVLATPGGKIYVRWFLVDRRLYTLGIAGRKGEPDPEDVDFFFENASFDND
jgi:hypothetical protein